MGQGGGLKGEGVGLYSTRDSVYPIDSPVKQSILSMLEDEGPLSFDEIVGRLGKAKSTVSVHLKGLSEDGVIDVQTDPDDARKKTFLLSGRRVGALSVQDRLPPDRLQGFPAAEFADIPSLYRFMCCQVRTAMMEAGINIEPVLHTAGGAVGQSIASMLDCSEMHECCTGLSKFWERYGMGTLSFESYDPLVIVATDCFECGSLPNVGRPVCAFGKGVLGAVFREMYRQEVTVTETRCYAMGDGACRFEIRPLHPRYPQGPERCPSTRKNNPRQGMQRQ